MKDNEERGIIKWKPFNSCFNQEKIIADIYNSKNRQIVPTLSEDQLINISNKIIEAFYLKLSVQIDYYYDGYIKNIQGIINYIDISQNKIWLNNHTLFFKQIINISEIVN